MAGLSSFPSNIDSFTRHYEISAADVPSVVRFQELKLKIRTPEEESEMAQLATKLRPNFISSEDFNKFQDALVSMQIFIRDNVAGYIDTARDEALIAIDQKKNAIIVYLDSIEAGKLRNDMGIMDELTTATKSSLVAAINEVNAKAPSNASTSTKGIVQLSSTQSTSESLAATPKLVKDHADLNTASVHGSTSAATANRLIHRDASGRAKIAAPSASDDIARLDTVTGQVGTLSNLQTTAKTNIVSAVNELFTSVSSGKSTIETAIAGKGGTVSKAGSVATFPELVNGVNSIQQGRYLRQVATPGSSEYPVSANFSGPIGPRIATFPPGTKVIAFSGHGTNSVSGSSTFSAYTQQDNGLWIQLVLYDRNGMAWNLMREGSSNHTIRTGSFPTSFTGLTIDFTAQTSNLAILQPSSAQVNNVKVNSPMPVGFDINGETWLTFAVTDPINAANMKMNVAIGAVSIISM